ncbi:unnamed protein product [Rotaria sp. Silwood1]|nr:unnamed protein product [Rotaria sp. Silwood1]CAF1131112.1 unnamed protein product [Rotaria sp. Silwood1]CAF3449973.1 unnamed protein product [Rotaria sp. Silwood1]CAF4570096.1 unnamed protein product [Rotaria sp. Silwood1]
MSKRSEVEPTSLSSTTTSEIKIFYYIDHEDLPYLTKLNVTGLPRLKDFKNALGRNCSKYKFFFVTNDPSMGKVREEIINDEEILPVDTQDRILAYLISIEDSTTSSDGGLGGGNKQSKHLHIHRDDTILTSTTNSSFNIQQASPVGSLPWIVHTQPVQNTYNNPQQQILLHHQQSLLNSTTSMNSTISNTNNTMADNERFGLGPNLIDNSDMATIARAMAEPDSGLDIRDRKWLNVPIPKSFLVDEEPEDYESVAAPTSTIDHRSGDSLLAKLREEVHSAIQRSITANERAQKLLYMNLCPEQEKELCQVIVDICAEQGTYEGFFGLLSQSLCDSKPKYIQYFEELFQDQYEIINSLENVQLPNVAKFFAHLLFSNSISWGVLDCFHSTAQDTISSARVYVKDLLLQLVEFINKS